MSLKNNNPGNIRTTDIHWQGENTPKNVPFESFVSMAAGYRALMANLQTYIGRGIDTIPKIIAKWAPPSENNTTAYINAVVKDTGFSTSQKLSPDQNTLTKLAAAISKHENGKAAIMADVQAGWNLLKKKYNRKSIYSTLCGCCGSLCNT